MKRPIRTGFTAALICAVMGWCAEGMAQMAPTEPQNMLTDAEKAEGWHLLFDGRTLLGWVHRGGTAQWTVEDGAIAAEAQGGPSYIGTAQEYANFHLKVDYWTDEGHNSGVFLRGPRDPNARVNQFSFYEINISDDHKTFPTGSIVEVIRFDPPPKTAEQWNTFEIAAEGDHIVVKLNGTVTADIKNSLHYAGAIVLQAFGKGKVKFRNLKIKPLS
jgi:hypothetical protein